MMINSPMLTLFLLFLLTSPPSTPQLLFAGLCRLEAMRAICLLDVVRYMLFMVFMLIAYQAKTSPFIWYAATK